MKEHAFREGLRDAIPTALGYASIGLACGVVSVNSGISAVEMGLMSLFVYAGSAQFVICAMILAGAPLLSIAVTVFFVNLRNFLMCLHATTIFQGNRLGSNILIGSFVTDESYAVLLRKHIEDKQIAPSWMYGNNFAGYASGYIYDSRQSDWWSYSKSRAVWVGLCLGRYVRRDFLRATSGDGSDYLYEESWFDSYGCFFDLCLISQPCIVLCSSLISNLNWLFCGGMVRW